MNSPAPARPTAPAAPPATVTALVALTKLVGHAATIGLYSFHRDEIYLMASARRVAWGSPDHAPLTPALSWLTTRLVGESAAGQRAPDVIAGALVVALAGLMARRMGGGALAELLAAGAALIAPVFLYMGGVHSTNSVEQLAVAAASYLLLMILTAAPSPRRPLLWIALGGVMGVALLNKYTAGIFIAASLFALVATPARRHLRSPWPWIAAAIALALWSPNLAWQAAHGAPALDFLRETRAAIAAARAPLSLVVDQARLLGPIPLALVAFGLARGLRRGAPLEARLFAFLAVFAAACVALAGGKPYYIAPAYPALFAVGAAALAPRSGKPRDHLSAVLLRPRIVGIACALSLAIGALGTLPLLPSGAPQRLGLRALNPELVEFADYPRLACDLAALSEREGQGRTLAVLTASYGMAAAIELYGPARGLPAPISGANSYYLWSDVDAAPSILLAHAYDPALLRRAFAVVRPAGEITGDGTSRFDFPRVVYRCEGPLAPLREAWPLFRHFD